MSLSDQPGGVKHRSKNIYRCNRYLPKATQAGFRQVAVNEPENQPFSGYTHGSHDQKTLQPPP
jgi:hypothetical protein